jgi:hypothetical protein
MRNWKLFLAVLLCSGLGITLGLSGCGDDDDDENAARCQAACSKIVSCAADFIVPIDFTVQECTDSCKAEVDAEAQCAFGCDTDASCIDYAECIVVNCGITFD